MFHCLSPKIHRLFFFFFLSFLFFVFSYLFVSPFLWLHIVFGLFANKHLKKSFILQVRMTGIWTDYRILHTISYICMYYFVFNKSLHLNFEGNTHDKMLLFYKFKSEIKMFSVCITRKYISSTFCSVLLCTLSKTITAANLSF